MRRERHLLDNDNEEARLTIIDVLYFLVALFLLAALSPAFIDGFNSAAPQMSPGTELVWSAVLPFSVLVMLSLIYRKSIGGR